MLFYSLKVTLCWVVFYLIYYLLLRRDTFFRLSRWYLLGAFLSGLIIPMLEWRWQTTQPPLAAYLQPVTVGVERLQETMSASSQEPQLLSFWNLLTGVYLAGAAFFLARLCHGLFQIYRLYRSAGIVQNIGYRLVSTHAPHAPFSFFKNLFWSEKFEADEEDREHIIRHEEAHIFQWHSLDVMLLEVVGVFMWWNPFQYLFKNAIKITHEYLADAHATANFSKKQYGRLLLRQSQSGMQIAISNSLFSSQLKQRIIMLSKNKSSRWTALRYLVALPAIALLLLAFSTAEKESRAAIQGIVPVEQIVTDTIPEGKVFRDADEKPRFPGCEEIEKTSDKEACAQKKMFEFIFKNIKYPEEARKDGIEGMVVVSLIIEEDGTVSNPEIVRSLSKQCDKEIIRLVEAMPRFIPGRQEGRVVRTQFYLPVKFQTD